MNNQSSGYVKHRIPDFYLVRDDESGFVLRYDSYGQAAEAVEAAAIAGNPCHLQILGGWDDA